jgi:hypothetical protein
MIFHDGLRIEKRGLERLELLNEVFPGGATWTMEAAAAILEDDETKVGQMRASVKKLVEEMVVEEIGSVFGDTAPIRYR